MAGSRRGAKGHEVCAVSGDYTPSATKGTIK